MNTVASNSIEPIDVALEASKLKKLIVKNFRCIGSTPVEIELNDIVVLVGPNNAGKSTILRAYEVVMNHGSAEGNLTLADFPNEQINSDACPEIELQTYVRDDKPAKRWLQQDTETGSEFVRERWTWSAPGPPKRQGYNRETNAWDEEVPWGAPNVAKVRRPQPQRIDAFASPEEQAKRIVDLLRQALIDRANLASSEGESPESPLQQVKNFIASMQSKIVEEAQSRITSIETQLGDFLNEVFQGYRVSFEAKPDQVEDKALNLFASYPTLRMGPSGEHLAPVDKQGSGARRTLLWAALKLLGEQAPGKKPQKGKSKKSKESLESQTAARPNVLLIDEPEICLHPSAIRDACRVLYDLARPGNNWQVMVTTHSPVFLDLTRDNTTIVRVTRGATGKILGTTVFRPDRVKLDSCDKRNLKLLNVWDPYVGEFFFGGRTILVEGDTEYSVFRTLIDQNPLMFKHVHVVRARGKGILISLVKILNHFGASYSVLHDSDRPLSGSAWGTNLSLLNEVNSGPNPKMVRLVAAIPDFEGGVFGTNAQSDKPYKAVLTIESDQAAKTKAVQLLEALCDHSKPLPAGTIAWRHMEDLEKVLTITGVVAGEST